MTKFGYAISSEEHHPLEIVRQTQMAEAVGFSFAMISDHFHPWVSTQGHSPFVWSVIGALANATKRLVIGTGGVGLAWAGYTSGAPAQGADVLRGMHAVLIFGPAVFLLPAILIVGTRAFGRLPRHSLPQST